MRDEVIVVGGLLVILSFVPLFRNPFHPERYGGQVTPVNFWQWVSMELWELRSGIELRAGVR